MKLYLLTACFIGAFCNGEVSAQSAPTPEKFKLLTETLATKGLGEFLVTAKAKNWIPPIARSNWAQSQTNNSAVRAEEEEALHFAEVYLDALVEFNALPVETNGDLIKKVSTLSAAGNWIASQKAYGNLFVARHSLDLALASIGKLLVEPTVSPEALSALNSVLSPFWTSAEFRSAVLDAEIGGGFFVNLKDEASLRAIWQEGAMRSIEARNPNLKQKLGYPNRMTSLTIEPSKLSFFQEEQITALPTAKTWLHGNHFDRIVNGIEPINAVKLRDLVRFRVAIKEIPDESLKSDVYPGLQGAFDEAWRKYCQSIGGRVENLKLGISAWTAYEKIINNKIVPDSE